MPGNKSLNNDTENDALAFEYVSGTLRGEERAQFTLLLSDDDALQKSVRFWEEQLVKMQPEDTLAPAPNVWDDISAKINTPKYTVHNDIKAPIVTRFWQWLAPSFAAAALVLAVLIAYPQFGEQQPNADYVAVLTDDSGRALLTALTADNEKSMWLKWETKDISAGTNAQLWAVSRRDGETRPIAVLESTQTDKILLDEATWRLVTDAEFLMLTEEEPGGSAIDEPSDMLLAKGFCVRFSPS